MNDYLALIMLGAIGGMSALMWSIDHKLEQMLDVLRTIAAKDP